MGTSHCIFITPFGGSTSPVAPCSTVRCCTPIQQHIRLTMTAAHYVMQACHRRSMRRAHCTILFRTEALLRLVDIINHGMLVKRYLIPLHHCCDWLASIMKADRDRASAVISRGKAVHTAWLPAPKYMYRDRLYRGGGLSNSSRGPRGRLFSLGPHSALPFSGF